MKTAVFSIWVPTLVFAIAACSQLRDNEGGPDASYDKSSTGGRAGSPNPMTSGSGGSTAGAGAGGDSTAGTGGTGSGGSNAGSGGSGGAAGSSVDAGGGKGGSPTGPDGSTAGGAAGTGGAGNGGAGTTGAGGSTTGTGGGTGGSAGNTGGSSTGGSTGGTAGTAGTAGAGAGGPDAAIDAIDPDSGPAIVVCGGVTCELGQDCCFLDAKCFDVTNRAACPLPPPTSGSDPCASNSDCPPDQYCEASDSNLCVGPGVCQSRPNCGFSSDFIYCGCNGVTYPNYQSACRDGARLGRRTGAGCGMKVPLPDGGRPITLCGLDSQCPSGQKCCPIMGECYDPVTQTGLCAEPPAGTRYPCLVDSDCDPEEYCAGATCTAPGGCKETGGSCNGELSPVCGCNGKNYMNAACADISGARVRHSGYCTDADTP